MVSQGDIVVGKYKGFQMDSESLFSFGRGKGWGIWERSLRIDVFGVVLSLGGLWRSQRRHRGPVRGLAGSHTSGSIRDFGEIRVVIGGRFGVGLRFLSLRPIIIGRHNPLTPSRCGGQQTSQSFDWDL